MTVTVQDLSYSYPQKAVLDGVQLHLSEMDIMCIVGPNGSGKSTLVKCIEGLLTPASGRILFDKVDASQLSRSQIARRVGYVPQSTRLLFSSSVFDTVLMGRKPHYAWRCSDEDVDIVVDILQMMELDELAMDEFNTLSGGQQQRVLIARALAQQPELLLLDEPTSALDIAHQLEVMDMLQELVRARQIGVIMVVHDLNLAARYADTIVLLRDGRVFASGPAPKTLTNANLQQVYGVEAHIHSHEGILSVTPVKRVSRGGTTRLRAVGA